MPSLLRSLGIGRWAVGWELRVENDAAVATHDYESLRNELVLLRGSAEDRGIGFHASDDLGLFRGPDRAAVRAKTADDPDLFFRIDPLGYVRTVGEAATPWSPDRARRWNPAGRSAVDVSGYWERLRDLRT